MANTVRPSWPTPNRRGNGTAPIVGGVTARAMSSFHVRDLVLPSPLGKKFGAEEKVDFLKAIVVCNSCYRLDIAFTGLINRVVIFATE